MPRRQRTVIFLHIPRTGGTTLHRLPERNYGRNQVLNLYGSDRDQEIERFANLPEDQRANYKFIKGHLVFGFHKLVPVHCTYVTFLREPIARVRSFYEYVRSHPEHYLHQVAAHEPHGLKGLLERQASGELFNLQTRMIAGDLDSANWLDRGALERAKENLQTHFSLIGLVEAFDASLILLTRAHGWRFPFYVKRNANRRAPDKLDTKTHDLLREANALDLELYELARKLFESQVRSAGESFEAEVRRFLRLNFWCGIVQPKLLLRRIPVIC